MCGGGGGGGGRLRDWVEADRYLGQQKPPADTADREGGNDQHKRRAAVTSDQPRATSHAGDLAVIMLAVARF